MPSERVQRRIDRLLDQAEEAADNREWPMVAESVRMVLELDPENADAKAFAAMVRQADQSIAEPLPAVDVVTESESTLELSDQPSTFASGRYTVSKFLGEGGKKKVYLAHDNTLDRDVAFALIKTEGLDETSRERVKREAQAMGRMGTHPCIMPIYDLGEENGQPFMVQPLMSGGDVEGLVEKAEGPLELDRAITIATQTAQGLSFAHSKGIVHRDLKPGNVWLDEDGAAKIGDFGLAVATDRSRLTVEKVMVGTVSYMPPEQATGGEVTPKADLYSLGAMLYEMCTGRVPFMGDDDIGIISQHINTPPVAPSWHNSQIPKTLDSLILRLLSKDPSERPETADEVLAALEAVDLTAVEEREENGKGSLDSMACGVFVGRHREMDQLKSIFEDVLSGRGRMVTLVGEPGIGKTRTAQELATYAGMRGAEVLWGRSYESGGAPPYWPWVQAIRSHVAATEPQELRNQLGATAPVIAEVVSDLKSKLPDIPAPTQIEDPESARFRLFDSISTFLKQISSSTPLVLMLEDLHWSDKPSLKLLEFVARELANSRILIVGNYRDMELNRRHPLSVTLGDLTRERLFERVVLRGLQRHDVERFIEIAAGITPPAALIDTVHSQTEGNPLFVTETVRFLIQEGDITTGQSSKGGTTSWEIRIPEGVREVIGRRLDRLSERCNEVLTTASVIGRQFRFPVLLKLSDSITDDILLDVMDEANAARVIEELPEEIGLYQFTHALMQETLTSELSANRLVRMHAQIAVALEEHYGDEAEEHSAELVEHFFEAETVLGTERLEKYSLAAANHSFRSFAYDSALLILEKVIPSIKPERTDLLTGELLAAFARAKHASGTREIRWAVNREMQRAMSIFEREHAGMQAFKMLANFWELAGVDTGGASLIERAIRILPESSLESAYLWSKLGRFRAIDLADYDGGIEALDRAEELANDLGDNHVLARIAADRARVVISNRGEPEEIIRLCEQAELLNHDPEDRLLTSQVGFVSTQSYLRLGRLSDAIKASRKSLNAARATGDANRIVGSATLASMVSTASGDFSSAAEAASEGYAIDPYDGRIVAAKAVPAYLTEGAAAGDAIVKEHVLWVRDHPSGSEIDHFGFMVPAGIRFVVLGDTDGWRMVEELAGSIEFADTEINWLHFRAAKALEQCDPKEIKATYESSDGPSFEGSFHKGIVQCRLLRALGEFDEAVRVIEQAEVESEKHGFRVSLAACRVEHGDALLDRNGPGDHEKAIELQDEAISIATELGMKPLLERVLAKREILKA